MEIHGLQYRSDVIPEQLFTSKCLFWFGKLCFRVDQLPGLGSLSTRPGISFLHGSFQSTFQLGRLSFWGSSHWIMYCWLNQYLIFFLGVLASCLSRSDDSYLHVQFHIFSNNLPKIQGGNSLLTYLIARFYHEDSRPTISMVLLLYCFACLILNLQVPLLTM